MTDLVGTPTEMVDETGHIAWHSRSTVWGVTVWNRDASSYTPLRFPGQYYDPETGLHHNYFRHYDPETARYLTLDPLGLDPGPNPFTYVDNPFTLEDPLGLTPCDETDPTWGGRVRFSTGPGGRSGTMRAKIEPGMTGGTTRPPTNVVGYQKYKKWNKTHLLGAQIGGSNKDTRNFVAMHRNANSPVMKAIEDQIRHAVDKNNEAINYTVSSFHHRPELARCRVRTAWTRLVMRVVEHRSLRRSRQDLRVATACSTRALILAWDRLTVF